MILFNVWHLLLLISIVLLFVGIASYAKAQENYTRLLKRSILTSCTLLFFAFTFVPNIPFSASYKMNLGNENSVSNNNGTEVEKHTNTIFKVLESFKYILKKFN
jgi:hypothetical protein